MDNLENKKTTKFEVWLEGYAATGESGTAQRLLKRGETNTLWEGDTFNDACDKALGALRWEKKRYYNKERNTYWACRFFDNESDARKSFG